jgi:competence protein ComEC
MPRAKSKVVNLLVIVALAGGLIWYVQTQRRSTPPALASVAFLDVGQGDSELITLSADYQILVDGGPSQQVIDQLSLYMPIADRVIELVVLTHPDADHLAGLLSVLTEYEVEQILMPDVAKDTRMYQEWMELIEEQGIEHRRLREPETITLNDGVTLTVLHPSAETMLKKMAANDWSIVMRLDINQISFLLTGDIEKEIEAELVERYATQLRADVLKVPHHGSKTSSTQAFLQAVRPEFAVMSVAKDNRYGHPHREVTQRYAASHIPVRRTDEEGTMVFRTDGETIWQEKPLFSALPFVGKKYERVYTFEQR